MIGGEKRYCSSVRPGCSRLSPPEVRVDSVNGDWEGAADVVALGVVDTVLGEDCQGFGVFDAFGDRLVAEVFC